MEQRKKRRDQAVQLESGSVGKGRVLQGKETLSVKALRKDLSMHPKNSKNVSVATGRRGAQKEAKILKDFSSHCKAFEFYETGTTSGGL